MTKPKRNLRRSGTCKECRGKLHGSPMASWEWFHDPMPDGEEKKCKLYGYAQAISPLEELMGNGE